MPITTVTVWDEVLAERRAHHIACRDTQGASRETWRADEVTRWRADLAAARVDLDNALGIGTGTVIDPRDALIRLMAAAAAWVDAMDQTTGVGT
jgi:hypothetical protein